MSARIFATLLLFIALQPLYGASWPLFRGTAARTGVITEQAEPALTPLWKVTTHGGFVSSPVVYKGIVYAGCHDCSVWAWDARTGAALWQYSTSGWVNATPCVSSDTVYVPGEDMNLYAFDRLTGDLRWQTFTGSKDCSSPVLNNGSLYFLSGYPERTLYCVDAKSGVIVNRFAVSQFGFSSVAIANGRLFFGTNDGVFHCLDLASGLERWHLQTRGGIFYSSPAAENDALFAVADGDERKLYRINPDNGAVVWYSVEFDSRTATASSVSVDDTRVYVVTTCNGKLHLSAYPKAGVSPVAPLWSKTIGVPNPLGLLSSPTVANDVVYAGSGDGMLYALSSADGSYMEPGTGNLTANATGYFLCGPDARTRGIVASPAVSNGTVFVGTYDGVFQALRCARSTALTTPDTGDTCVNNTVVKAEVSDAAPVPYALEYGAGTAPAEWITISTGAIDGSTDTVARWDTSALEDGPCSLRLTVSGDAARRAVNRVQIDNAPQPPSGLTAADTPFDGGGSIDLAWTLSTDDGGNDNDVLGYRVYRSTWAGGFTALSSVANDVRRYADTSAQPEIRYHYTVTAFDASSESAGAASASASSLADGIPIDPNTGGTAILLLNGATTELVIEPDTFETPVRIGIRAPTDYPGTGIPENLAATTIVREFGVTPAGTRFLKPVVLKIPYLAQETAGTARENLRICWWDETKGEWRIVNTSDPGSENGRVWAAVPHLSLYRIMAYKAGSEPLLSSDKVYAYPNPAKGDTARFKYYLGDKADVTVDVYNVAGELIAHLVKNDNPAGIASEIDWDIASIASGLYVFRLEAKSGSHRKAVKKKMAIIH